MSKFTYLKPKSENELAMASLYKRIKDEDSEINPLTLAKAIKQMLSDYYENNGTVNYRIKDDIHYINIEEPISLSQWNDEASEERDKTVIFKLEAILTPNKYEWNYKFNAEDEETGKYYGHEESVIKMPEDVFRSEEGLEFEYYFLDEIYDDEFGRFKNDIFGNKERIEDEQFDEEKYYPELEESFTHLKPKSEEEMSQALKQMCSSENKGDVDLMSLKQLPEGTTFSNGGYVRLSSLKQLPKGTSFSNVGNVYLKSLEQLPKGTIFSNGGDVYSNSLEQLPEGTTFSNGGGVYLRSLEQLPEDFVYTGMDYVYLKNNKIIKGPIGVRTDEGFTHLKPKSEEELKNAKNEVRKQIKILQTKTAKLRQYHPDDDNPFGAGSVRQAKQYLYDQLRKLKNLILTPEDRLKMHVRAEKLADKREAKWEIKMREIRKKQKTLTPKQRAINKIIDLQYNKRLSWDPRYRNPIIVQINKLKKEFNIKSSDLRRQHEYNPKYE